jgi:branched-chain amino acid transport system permease protein
VKEFVQFALLGLGSGSLIAGIALGVVLTYRGSGIINLATGAVAMVTGYFFFAFKTGHGVFPELGTAAAIVLGLAAAVLTGVLSEVLVFRPLRTASPLAKLVASLGILLLAQAGMLLIFGTTPKTQPPVLPKELVAVGDVKVPVDRFILAGVVIAITIVLTLVYRWSRFGLQTRAASENEVAAMLAGLSPNRLSMTNTLLACLVAGLLGLFAASITGLDTGTLPLLVVPALAAALFARFTSFGIACAAGLLIGIAQNLIYIASTKSWFPQDRGHSLPGIQDLLVFLILVIAMFWRGASLPGRGELVEQRLPPVPRPERLLRPAVIGLLVAGAALILFPYDFRQAVINTLIGVVICLSLVVITGFVGQVSLVQLALAGVSGFIISHLAVDAGIGFPAAPIIAAVATTILGLLIAVSALRVRGVSLAVVTLAAAVTIEQFGFVNSRWGAGTAGSPVPQPHLWGLELGSNAPFRGLDGKLPSPVLGFLILFGCVAICLFVANIRRSNLGQRMLAVRSNERAAAAAGINVRNVKLIAFGLSSFIAAIAGAMYAYNFGSVSALRFSALTALGLIAFAYVGGITMVSGAIFAGHISTQALFPHIFEEWVLPADKVGTYTLLVGGIGVLLTLIFNPEGIAGTAWKKKQEKKRRLEAGLAKPNRLQVLLSRTRRGAASPSGGGP